MLQWVLNLFRREAVAPADVIVEDHAPLPLCACSELCCLRYPDERCRRLEGEDERE